MTKSKFLIGLVLIIAVVLVTSGVYVYTNYKLVNGKLVSTNDLVYVDIEQGYFDAYEEGNTDAQVEYAEKMRSLGIHPTLADLYLARALINRGTVDFDEEKNADEAVKLLEGVLVEEPNNAEALSALAYAHEIKGEFAKAIEYYDLALRIDDDNAYIYNLRGHAYDLMGQLDKAEDDYVKSLELDPNNVGALINMARIYYRLGEPDLAADFAYEAIDLSENSYLTAIASDLVGKIAIDTREYDLALEYFNYAIKNNPDFPGAYEKRAYVYLLQTTGKKPAEVTALLAKVTADIDATSKIHPESSFLFVLKGLQQDVLKQPDAAKASYMRALAMVDKDITLGEVDKENMRAEIEALLKQSK